MIKVCVQVVLNEKILKISRFRDVNILQDTFFPHKTRTILPINIHSSILKNRIMAKKECYTLKPGERTMYRRSFFSFQQTEFGTEQKVQILNCGEMNVGIYRFRYEFYPGLRYI